MLCCLPLIRTYHHRSATLLYNAIIVYRSTGEEASTERLGLHREHFSNMNTSKNTQASLIADKTVLCYDIQNMAFENDSTQTHILHDLRKTCS
jgi:hypothetical protein